MHLERLAAKSQTAAPEVQERRLVMSLKGRTSDSAETIRFQLLRGRHGVAAHRCGLFADLIWGVGQ